MRLTRASSFRPFSGSHDSEFVSALKAGTGHRNSGTREGDRTTVGPLGHCSVLRIQKLRRPGLPLPPLTHMALILSHTTVTEVTKLTGTVSPTFCTEEGAWRPRGSGDWLGTSGATRPRGLLPITHYRCALCSYGNCHTDTEVPWLAVTCSELWSQ